MAVRKSFINEVKLEYSGKENCNHEERAERIFCTVESKLHKHEFVLHYLGEGKGEDKIVLVHFLTEHHAMKTYWGSGDIVPRIFDLGTRWR